MDKMIITGEKFDFVENITPGEIINNVKFSIKRMPYNSGKIFVNEGKDIGIAILNINDIIYESPEQKKGTLFGGLNQFMHFINENYKNKIINSLNDNPLYIFYSIENSNQIITITESEPLDSKNNYSDLKKIDGLSLRTISTIENKFANSELVYGLHIDHIDSLTREKLSNDVLINIPNLLNDAYKKRFEYLNQKLESMNDKLRQYRKL